MRDKGTATKRARAALERDAEADRPEIWIERRPDTEILADARAVDAALAAGGGLPLAGTVVAVAGNIDVAGLTTTAGCPAYGYRPAGDATAVERLRTAGAVVLGSTNLDQFATGLTGTRSPYGAVRNAIDPRRVAGGASAGATVAVALGIADLGIGTDTAGGVRVPAALNGVVGVGPTRGLVPLNGVVPTFRSLDRVGVLAGTVTAAERALTVMSGPHPQDPTSRGMPVGSGPVDLHTVQPLGGYRIGVASAAQLGEMAPGWLEALEVLLGELQRAGATIVTKDVTPFLHAAELLATGAFAAERYAAVGEFVAAHPDRVDPTVAATIDAARDVPAHRLFADMARLDELRLKVGRRLSGVDALLLPTATRHPTLDEVAADPDGVDSQLGRLAGCASLLDLAALAVPAGTVPAPTMPIAEGPALPFGVTLYGPAFSDHQLAALARTTPFAARGGWEVPRPRDATPAPIPGDAVRLVVSGPHMTGQPLSEDLVKAGASLLETTFTAPSYRLFALDTAPPIPGLVRTGTGGAAIEVEVWELPVRAFGELVASTPEPTVIGSVQLADGTWQPGFLCEPYGIREAREITEFGGWRRYRQAAGSGVG